MRRTSHEWCPVRSERADIRQAHQERCSRVDSHVFEYDSGLLWVLFNQVSMHAADTRFVCCRGNARACVHAASKNVGAKCIVVEDVHVAKDRT